jgi:hypothetical protein
MADREGSIMPAIVWAESMQTELRGAFRAAKYAGALRAFPHLTRGQVQSAIRRFVFDFDTEKANIDDADVITPAEARARLAAYDGDAFLDGVARLVEDRRVSMQATRIA